MDLRSVFLGVSFALMWSSAFTSARIIVAHAPPLASLSLRFFCSGVIALCLARALGQSLKLSRPQLRPTVIFGICQNALYLGFFFVAMQRIEASVASIMASTLPLTVALARWIMGAGRPAPVAIAGLLIGFAGVGLIMGGRATGLGLDPVGIGYALVGVLALTFATLAVRGAAKGGNLLAVVGWQMLVGALALGIAAPLLEEIEVSWSWSLLAAFSYTVLIPGIVATATWFVLVNRIGEVRAATYHFLNPFFGVLIAALVLGETLGPRDVLGAAVVAVGILMVQLARQRRLA